MIRQIWRLAWLKLIPLFLLTIIGGVIASTHFDVHHMTLKAIILSAVGIVTYISAATTLVHILTSQFYHSSVRRLGIRRSATIRFSVRIIGYIIILLGLLAILHIPISKILVGSALIGVVLSVAAQQALANFFASVVIIIDRPFTLGQDIKIVSGGLGGEYEGTVIDINSTHTLLELADGSIVRLPNATVLSASAIIEAPKKPPHQKSGKAIKK